MTRTIPLIGYKLFNYIDNTCNITNYKNYYQDLIDNLIYYNSRVFNLYDESIFHRIYDIDMTNTKRQYVYFTKNIIKPYFSKNVVSMGFFIMTKDNIFDSTKKTYNKFREMVIQAPSYSIFNTKNKHILLPKPYIIHGVSGDMYTIDDIAETSNYYAITRYIANIIGEYQVDMIN